MRLVAPAVQENSTVSPRNHAGGPFPKSGFIIICNNLNPVIVPSQIADAKLDLIKRLDQIILILALHVLNRIHCRKDDRVILNLKIG